VTDIATRVAGVTVSVVDPETLPIVAWIVVDPVAPDAARPSDPAVLLMRATSVLVEFHLTEAVRFCVEPSEKMPVAVNCSVVPSAMLGLVGVTSRVLSVAAVTAKVVDPDIAPDAAAMVVEPVSTAMTEPADSAVLLTVATLVLDELHVTEAVRFCVVPSENVPVATSC